MGKNYKAIHYIQEKLNGYNSKFVDSVIRCFNNVEQSKEGNGCLSNTVALYICAKEYGYNPKICFGLCSFEEKEFYHAWLEIDEIIIDISIYGNVNYSPLALWDKKIDTPYIGSYVDSHIHYGKFLFDNDWEEAQISRAEGLTLEQYMDGLPNYEMWKLVCKYLNRTLTKELIGHLREHIKDVKIEKAI